MDYVANNNMRVAAASERLVRNNYQLDAPFATCFRIFMIENIYFVKRYAITPSIVDKPSNLLLENVFINFASQEMFVMATHDKMVLSVVSFLDQCLHLSAVSFESKQFLVFLNEIFILNIYSIEVSFVF